MKLNTVILNKWTCLSCGSCCEVLMPNCKYYDKDNYLCLNYENRPWMCRQKLLLGDEFAIDTCNLIGKLREWKDGLKDKTKCDRVAEAITNIIFGATKEQLNNIQSKLTQDDIDKISKDMEEYKDAFAKGG